MRSEELRALGRLASDAAAGARKLAAGLVGGGVHAYALTRVRENSGRHISHSGRDLAARLEELVAAWPVGVSEVALVGHSMGGLVARSACHYGARSAGVKDLGYGYIIDEDWEGHDPDRRWTDTGTEIPYLDSAEHYFVSATITRDPDAPLGRALGDLLEDWLGRRALPAPRLALAAGPPAG